MVGWLGPLLEEAAKALGVVLVVMLSKEFDNPTDGLVYGTASGLGFAATENLVYLVAGAGGPALEGQLFLILLRTVMAAGIHAVCSAAFGGCLGFAYLSRKRAQRFGWALIGLIGAVGIHAGWNLIVLRVVSVGDPTSVSRWLIATPALYAALSDGAFCLSAIGTADSGSGTRRGGRTRCCSRMGPRGDSLLPASDSIGVVAIPAGTNGAGPLADAVGLS